MGGFYDNRQGRQKSYKIQMWMRWKAEPKKYDFISVEIFDLTYKDTFSCAPDTLSCKPDTFLYAADAFMSAPDIFSCAPDTF